MGLGITVNELKNTKNGGITDLNIAANIVDYAITYSDEVILKKIDPTILGNALIKSIERKK